MLQINPFVPNVSNVTSNGASGTHPEWWAAGRDRLNIDMDLFRLVQTRIQRPAK